MCKTPAEPRNALHETSLSLSLSLSPSLPPIMHLWRQARCATPRGLRGDACAHTDTAGFSAKRTWKGERDAPPGRCSINFIVLFFNFLAPSAFFMADDCSRVGRCSLPPAPSTSLHPALILEEQELYFNCTLLKFEQRKRKPTMMKIIIRKIKQHTNTYTHTSTHTAECAAYASEQGGVKIALLPL